MKFTIALFMLIFLSPALRANDRPVDQSQGYLPNFSCQSGEFGLRLPIRYKDVESLSPHKRERIELIEDEITYKVVRKDLYFPGLTLGVVVPSNRRNAYLISYARITSSRWKNLSPFYIGQPVHSAARRLLPESQTDLRLERRYGMETSTVRFEIKKGRIVEVIYDCYTG
jgi:hypothetical protein